MQDGRHLRADLGSQIILASRGQPKHCFAVPAVTVVGAVDVVAPGSAAAQPVSKTASDQQDPTHVRPVTYTSLRVLSYDRCQPIPQDR
jgi:hypothetical protein